MSGDPYVYSGTTVLRNKLGIRDAGFLDHHERELVTQRIRQGTPTGNFDLRHIQAIHLHLFQDIYTWAGKIRTVEISKDGHLFQFRQYISTGFADVHRRIVAADYLTGLSSGEFAARAGEIIGDVNYVHPFREGNGRTRLQYLKQLAKRPGYSLDLTKLDRTAWIAASREAHNARYDATAHAIGVVLGQSETVTRKRKSSPCV